MITYKDIDRLGKRCIKNNGRPVEVWDDNGIKVNDKIYRQMEYGNYYKGNRYIIFRNTGKRGPQSTYANRENFTDQDRYIIIEYRLHETNLFEFVEVREGDYY